jgi:hypothetical protein
MPFRQKSVTDKRSAFDDNFYCCGESINKAPLFIILLKIFFGKYEQITVYYITLPTVALDSSRYERLANYHFGYPVISLISLNRGFRRPYIFR